MALSRRRGSFRTDFTCGDFLTEHDCCIGIYRILLKIFGNVFFKKTTFLTLNSIRTVLIQIMQKFLGMLVSGMFIPFMRFLCQQAVCLCARVQPGGLHQQIHHLYSQKILSYPEQWDPNITTLETKLSTLNINNSL